MKAALYLRVSTSDQTVENQRGPLEQLAAARGATETVTFEETESGAKRRPVLEALLAAAHRGEVGMVCVWALDRLGRGGVLEILGYVERLDRAGVRLVSRSEPWCEDRSDETRELRLAIMAWCGRQERARLIERTKAGQARARAQGRHIGRPGAPPLQLAAGARLVSEGQSLRAAASKVGVGKATLHRYLAALRSETATPRGASNPAPSVV